MVKEFKSTEALDLSSYDLEGSELLAVDWRTELKEIELKLRYPVAGWQFREKWTTSTEKGMRTIDCIKVVILNLDATPYGA